MEVTGYTALCSRRLPTYDVYVVALFKHRLHLGVTELRHGPPSLHEVLVEFPLELQLFAGRSPENGRDNLEVLK